MLDCLNEARCELHSQSLEHMKKFLSLASPLVVHAPEQAEDERGMHVLRVEACTQTEPVADSPMNSAPLSPGSQTGTDLNRNFFIGTDERKLEELAENISKLVSKEEETEYNEINSSLNNLTSYLSNMTYLTFTGSSHNFGYGSFGSDTKNDDQFTKIKAEIRSVKGALLNV